MVEIYTTIYLCYDEKTNHNRWSRRKSARVVHHLDYHEYFPPNMDFFPKFKPFTTGLLISGSWKLDAGCQKRPSSLSPKVLSIHALFNADLPAVLKRYLFRISFYGKTGTK